MNACTSVFSVWTRYVVSAARNGMQLFVSNTGTVCSAVSQATASTVLKFAVDLYGLTFLSTFDPHLHAKNTEFCAKTGDFFLLYIAGDNSKS